MKSVLYKMFLDTEASLLWALRISLKIAIASLVIAVAASALLVFFDLPEWLVEPAGVVGALVTFWWVWEPTPKSRFER